MAARQSERAGWLGELEDPEGFEEEVRLPSPRNPHQHKTPIYVKMKRCQAEAYVLCLSCGRKDKDRAIRQKQEGRLLSDLARLGERIRKGRLVAAAKIHEAIGRLRERYPRVARYYRLEYDAQAKRLNYSVIEEKRGRAEELDGSYLLKTDRQDLSAEEVWRIYTLLSRAENAFRNMKSPLGERPIFHQIERRVETHIFLCVLAYHLLASIEKTLLDQGVHTSWATVRNILSTHQVATVVLPTDDGSVLRIRKGSTPEPQHVELYKLLGVPSEVMRPKKTWSDSKVTT